MNGRRQALLLEEMAEDLDRPRYLRLVVTILVHDRCPPGEETPCPCCKALEAVIIERRAVDDLIIDTETGDRIRAHDRTPEAWAALCQIAELHAVGLRCSLRTVDVLTDDTDRHIFASGGHRAQKTTTGLVWLALQLIRHGGDRRRFWLVSRTTDDAFKLLAKLFLGTGESPPILPTWLVRSSPQTAASRDLLTTLVDGSLIDLKSFDGDPGAARLKSDAIVAGLVDEAAHLPTGDSLSALRGRCADALGRLWLASTPRPSSFLKTEVVDPAIEFAGLRPEDGRAANGQHPGAVWRLETLSMLANPWIPLAGIQRDMRTVDMAKPENRRDYLGEWAASEGLCWTDFYDERHMITHEARDVSKLPPVILAAHGAPGHVDITAGRMKAIFGKANPHYKPARASNGRYILGLDVNVSPMNSTLLQVTAPADALDDREQWHIWVIDCVVTPNTNTYAHAQRMVSVELGRVIDPLGTGAPLKGCGMICDATSMGKIDPHAARHQQTGSLAEIFGRLDLDVRAPMYRDSKTGPGHTNGGRSDYFTLIHRMLAEGRIHVFSRCGALLNAFHAQIVEPDGNCPVDSRRGLWDQVMGPMDSFRYPLLAIMNSTTAPSGGPLPVVKWGG